MRKRYYLSFDMDDPRHREAEGLFAAQTSRKRTEYVVASILRANQADCLEKTVRRVLQDELRNIMISPQTKPSEEADTAVQLTDLPDSLINALEEL